ncbi:MAG: sel1 repeat family protein [Alphaproteobacteria bacterium]|nr:sel1 repeat family protein [Alphaproteobacteria bacterium]
MKLVAVVLAFVRGLRPQRSIPGASVCARKEGLAELLRRTREAAERGDAAAQSRLGLMYAMGQGVPKDAREANAWYRKGAEQGDADAQFRIGMAYTFGLGGIGKDHTQAACWIRKAATKGHPVAKQFVDYAGRGAVSDANPP